MSEHVEQLDIVVFAHRAKMERRPVAKDDVGCVVGFTHCGHAFYKSMLRANACEAATLLGIR